MASLPLEHNYSVQRYPQLSEEKLQTKPKAKGKLQRDDGLSQTNVSHDYSSRTNVDSANVKEISKSSTTVRSKASRKSKTSLSSRKHGKKRPLARHFEEDPSVESEKEIEKPQEKPYSPFVGLYCPVCTNPDCILNKVGMCRMLKNYANECKFCSKNCSCNDNNEIFPISGLVPRDQYGVAVTLLKENGGPIENSKEYTNRGRWCVPSAVSWNHQLDNWLTAYNTKKEDIKAESAQLRTLQRKSITLKKKPQESSTTDVSSKAAASERKIDDDGKALADDLELILEGQGFKIFKKGNEKILMNYDRNNCKYLGCNCVKASPKTNFVPCGCKDWAGTSPDKSDHPKAKKKSRISLMKDTPDGLIEMDRSQILGKNKNDAEVQENELVEDNLKRGSNADVKLQARDLMHQSRSDMWDLLPKVDVPHSDENRNEKRRSTSR